MKSAQPTFSEQSEKYEYLTATELDLLLKAAKKTRWPDRDWLAIRMAYRHGLRASELTAIEWSQIDLKGGRIRVNRRKGGRDTSHDLDGDVMRALRRIKAAQQTGTRFVFTSERGGPWASVSFSRMVERLGKKVLAHRLCRSRVDASLLRTRGQARTSRYIWIKPWQRSASADGGQKNTPCAKQRVFEHEVDGVCVTVAPR